jgi:L-arabinose isomerase
MSARSIIPDLAQFEVWFATGSQDLYGPETLAQVAEQSKQVVELLNKSSEIPVKIVWKPVLKSSDAIRRFFLDANSADNVLGVVAWMHTFSPSKMWIAGLGANDKPMLHLHTQANVALPWDKIDFDFMNLNQAAHGDREHAYIESRMGLPRTTVVGHASDPAAQKDVGTWVRAALGRWATRSMKVARFGDNMRYVAVSEGDKTEAEIMLGVQVNTWPINELADMVHAVSDADAAALVAEYLDLYDVADELKPGAPRADSLLYGAKIEIGLRSFLEAGGFSAFTDSFEDLGTLRQLPGLAVQRLMADGYGFGAEGDWKTAVLVRAAAVMGAGLPGGASLMEDYTYNLEPGNELILGAHMLEVNAALSSKKARLVIAPLGIGGKEDPVRLVFTADAGPAIVVAMSDQRERFRLVANVVDNVPLPAPMPNLPVGHAVWKPRPDFRTSATCWLMSGAAHHTVMSNQIGLDVIREFARLSRIELLVIDESTSVVAFEYGLRANAAYYRLSQGL